VFQVPSEQFQSNTPLNQLMPKLHVNYLLNVAQLATCTMPMNYRVTQ